MISLQSLKIPRGSRSDWAVQEYALIDYVELNVNEIFDAREGNTSIVANLNERYATKTYVQLAILNPDIEEVMAADLGVAPSDSTKIGYSLQIDNAGTGLTYSNVYSLASGTLVNPSLAFKQDGHDSGIYVSTLSTVEIMHFKILGGDAFTASVDGLGGAVTIAIGDVSLRADGNINWKNGTFEVINGIKITCVGAGPAFRSSFADIEMVQAFITGTGTSATQIAEAVVSSKLTVPDAVDASDATSYGQLLNEKTERENADDFLQDELDTESFTRAAADDVLQDNIDAEEAARIAADNNLQDNIDIETAARIAADNGKADKNGNSGEVFSVGTATEPYHAVRKEQVDNLTSIATESTAGIAKIATITDTNDGVVDNKIITPAKLRYGFGISLGIRGYISLPTWMSGLIIQWGRETPSANIQTFNFPLSGGFPNACNSIVSTADQTGGDIADLTHMAAIQNVSSTSFEFTGRSMSNSGSGAYANTFPFWWIAIGS